MKIFAYLRKSSEADDRQVQSLEDQKKWCEEEALRLGFKITKFFQNQKTGTKPRLREGFNEMSDEISEITELKKGKNPEKVLVICWKLDRLARNPIDGGVIQYFLSQNQIEINTSDGKYDKFINQILLGVLFGQASQYSIDLSKNVIRGVGSRISKGHFSSRAPTGYLNAIIFVIKNAKIYLQ